MTTRTMSLTQFQAFIGKLDAKTEAAAVRGFRRAAAFLHGRVVLEIKQAQPHPAVDTGELANSVNTTMIPGGAIVSVDAPHAPVMEYGRRAGSRMPPVDAIADWVRRKGLAGAPRAGKRSAASYESAIRGIAFVIARSIAQKGVVPRAFFRKAWDRSVSSMAILVSSEIVGAGWRATPSARRKLADGFRRAAR